MPPTPAAQRSQPAIPQPASLTFPPSVDEVGRFDRVECNIAGGGPRCLDYFLVCPEGLAFARWMDDLDSPGSHIVTANGIDLDLVFAGQHVMTWGTDMNELLSPENSGVYTKVEPILGEDCRF